MGNKPASAWRIGTEHEKFAFRRSDLRRLPYEGPDGIGAVLQGLQRFGWEAVQESGNTIALLKDGCSITLEPGGHSSCRARRWRRCTRPATRFTRTSPR